jgi:hypothetical protein
VFFAAIFAGHSGHQAARKGLDATKRQGWGIAAETYLAAMLLLMNPAVMGGGVLSAEQALEAVDGELTGKHPGRVVLAREKPSRDILIGARGHRQVMDNWLVQLARQEGARLPTNDAATLANRPDDTSQPRG